MQGKVGLGTSNILSMACELLLHKEAEKANRSSFLLIEEPEAHIHAQRQLKLVQSLEDATANQQIIITTHSPLLASVVKLGNIIIIKDVRPPYSKEMFFETLTYTEKPYEKTVHPNAAKKAPGS